MSLSSDEGKLAISSIDLDTFAGYDEWMMNEVRREVALETRTSFYSPKLWSKRQARLILRRLKTGSRIPRCYR